MKRYQVPPTSLPCDVTREPQGEQDRYGCTNFKELTGKQELKQQRENEHSLGDKRQVQAGVMLTHSVEPPLPGQEETGMFQAEEDAGKAAVTAGWERVQERDVGNRRVISSRGWEGHWSCFCNVF